VIGNLTSEGASSFILSRDFPRGVATAEVSLGLLKASLVLTEGGLGTRCKELLSLCELGLLMFSEVLFKLTSIAGSVLSFRRLLLRVLEG
jgi:hypothetical protein